MLYNFAADSFHTKKLCSRLSSRELRLQRENGRFAFLSPPLGDLGATYDDHLRLVGKRVRDLLLVLIELFRQVVRLRRYERLLVQNRRFRSNAGRLTQNFRQKGSPPTNHSSFHKTRLNDLSQGVKICRDFSSVLSQCTLLTDRQTDRQTDRILIARPRLHSMQRGKNCRNRIQNQTTSKFIHLW